MNKSAAHICMITLLLLTTTACGWHLRGSAGNVLNIESIYISAASQQSDMLRQLKRLLSASEVELVESATGADYRLVIVKEDSTRRTATVSASARVSERALTEYVEFLVLDQEGLPVIEHTRLSVERIFEYNENNVLATDDEAGLLKREMEAELARQIYNRLRQLNKAARAVDAPAS